jgi:uncharacterized protein YyaL (SSP411 family)
MSVNSSNRLKHEKSPYLLQHAGNPVDWYPWSDEAFEKAKAEDKPIFLSIGYSTCHWCHVMEHESFEDTEVARLMNESFVSIKVDREERPDIDSVYMKVCQMMTGSGGWPLSIIMTPDKQPFFAATYIPKETRYNQIGLLELIPRVREVWATRREDALNSADQITAALRNTTQEIRGQEISEAILHATFGQLAQRFDRENGGFDGAPKFPTPHNLLFLLRYHKRTKNQKAIEMAEKTLQAMIRGGIYDHLGFGFHRYSTDARWLLPHFEKMLYDQALLAAVFVEAYQATGRDEYEKTAREIFTYVLRDMTSPEGGFYSAEDADSEGEEGRFYLWTIDEIEKALSYEEAKLAKKVFHLDKDGNFPDERTGGNNSRNILYTSASQDELSYDQGKSETESLEYREKIRDKLFAAREQRIRPFKDDKVLTDWNGLMIAALAKGAQVLKEPEYARAASRAAGFILDKMCADEGRLLHRYRDNEAIIKASIDDYAFLIHGLLELYEATFEADYLKTAIRLCDDSVKHFWDEDNGGFYHTADDNENLLVRSKEIYDGAIPSGNSVAMLNLLRLGRITGRNDLEEKAHAIGKTFSGIVSQSPSVYTQFMVAVDFAMGPTYEIVISGNQQAADTERMLDVVRKPYVPNKVVIVRDVSEEDSAIAEIAPWVTNHTVKNGKATAYVCINHSCKLPTNDTDTMLELVNDDNRSWRR